MNQSPASSKASELNLDHLEKVAKRGDYITKAEVLTLIALARKGIAAEAPDGLASLPVAALNLDAITKWGAGMIAVGWQENKELYIKESDLRAALQQRQAPAPTACGNCPRETPYGPGICGTCLQAEAAPVASAEPFGYVWLSATGDSAIFAHNEDWCQAAVEQDGGRYVSVYAAPFAQAAPAPADENPGAHHLTPENVAAVIKDLREIESGAPAIPVQDRDWRTWAGVLARIMEHLATPAPEAAPVAPDAMRLKDDARDAARYRWLMRQVPSNIAAIFHEAAISEVGECIDDEIKAEQERASSHKGGGK